MVCLQIYSFASLCNDTIKLARFVAKWFRFLCFLRVYVACNWDFAYSKFVDILEIGVLLPTLVTFFLFPPIVQCVTRRSQVQAAETVFEPVYIRPNLLRPFPRPRTSL